MKFHSTIFTVMVVAAACCALNSCDESQRERVSVAVEVGIDGVIRKMEDQVDKGELAIRTGDQCYAKASRKLIKLKALKEDAAQNVGRFKARAEEFENNGKTELAQKNREQADFYERQSISYDETIRNRADKLRSIKQKRELIFEDVTLLREKIAYLKSMKEALDEDDLRRQLDAAESMVSEVRHQCNELEAEVDLLNSMD